MQILLANAKTMRDSCPQLPLSSPLFQSVANALALSMAELDIEDLAEQLDCNLQLATENWKRYQEFFAATPLPAIMAYNGQAYKHLRAHTLSSETLHFAQQHLWITCFLYGLLRPMDAIVPYRMEHSTRLTATDDIPMNRFWADMLTQVLIDSVKADDGVLVHLSTEEYEHLFHWKQVCSQVQVVQPLFYVQNGQRLKMQAVWAKTCRGAMTRFILEHRLRHPADLCAFSYEGFKYAPQHGDVLHPHFILTA